ncbi:MAG TPA: VanZ family protein [Longimicrobiales bacterium]|nr:VanZ family protein [Longimicrobiales bacterium]
MTWGWRLAGAATLIAIAAITLTPLEGPVTGSTYCLICGRRGAADAVLNLVMFLPVGWLVARVSTARPTASAALIGAGLSLAIEAIQIAVPGRDASLGDLAFNAAGALAGALALRAYSRARSAPTTAAACAGAAAVLLLGGFAQLLAPAFPDSRWWVQWTPELGHFERHGGRVIDASFGAEPLPGGRPLERRDEVLAAMSEVDDLVVRLVGSEPASRGLAPIVSVFDDRRREIFLLGGDGHDLVWRFRTRGAALRFDHVPLRFAGAGRLLERRDTSLLRLSAEREGRVWGEGACVEVDGARGPCARWTVGSSWRLLLPLDGPPGRWLELLWIATLFAPAGALAAYGRRRNTVAFAAAAAGAVLLLPAFTPVAGASPTEVLAAAAGILFPGVVLRRAGVPHGAPRAAPLSPSLRGPP